MNVVLFNKAADCLRQGKVGVLPTDTLYGLVGSALDKEVVERVYNIRGRDLDKPCIILIAHPQDLEKFEIVPTPEMASVMNTYWPGAISIVFPCNREQFTYLHRGKKSLAFRVPDPKHLELVALLEETGPIIAPSANLQGMEPAVTIGQAQEYFGERVDFYVDSGVCQGEPSTVISFESGLMKVLREGAIKIC